MKKARFERKTGRDRNRRLLRKSKEVELEQCVLASCGRPVRCMLWRTRVLDVVANLRPLALALAALRGLQLGGTSF
jgi:hypothetical protein